MFPDFVKSPIKAVNMNEKKCAGMKVIIVGGGIAGLSAAHILCAYPFIQVELYEKENDIGGQARSEFSGQCYVEYSWRIFGQSYDNLNYIIKQIGADDNFTPLNNACLIDNGKEHPLNTPAIARLAWNHSKNKVTDLNRFLALSMISKERALDELDSVNTYEYFNKNDVMQTVTGPFLGLEANNLSLGAVLKNLYSTSPNTVYDFTPENTRISKYPTQQSLFVPWKRYLLKRGVRFYTDSALQQINVNGAKSGSRITSVVINGSTQYADEYIFACSLPDLVQVCLQNQDLARRQTIRNMDKLQTNLQLYFTVNLYLSDELGASSSCTEIVLINTPWKLIIQKKRQWKSNYLQDCNRRITEVWNVGCLDQNVGLLYKKTVSECSKKEAINECLYQLETSAYIQHLLQQQNYTKLADILIQTDTWYQFQDDENNHLISLNPKFSFKPGTTHLVPNTAQPADLPKNMYLAGYYVNSTMGGASMEASCETGMQASRAILNRYRISNNLVKSNTSNNDNLPIKHTNEYLNKYLAPLAFLDKFLYGQQLRPITEIISPLLLLFIYVMLTIVVFIILVIVLKKVFKTVELSNSGQKTNPTNSKQKTNQIYTQQNSTRLVDYPRIMFDTHWKWQN